MSKIIKSFRIVEKEEELDLMEKKENSVANNKDSEFEIYKKIVMEEAKEKADAMVKIAEEYRESIKKEADSYYEEMKSAAKLEAKNIREEAYKEGQVSGYNEGEDLGFKKGYEEGKSKADEIIAQALEIKNNYLYLKDNSLREVEVQVIGLISDIFTRVFYEKMENDEDMITSLVLQGLKNLESVESLIIIVSKDDYENILKSKDLILAEASLINNLEIKYDISLNKGDCILETPKGNIDISLNEQMDEIKKLLKNILDNE